MFPIVRFARVVAIVCLLGTPALWSQAAPPVAARPAQQPRVEPCWQVAGITKAAMQERAALERETRSQIASVCADSALTPPQRRQQIQQIRQQAKEKQNALLSPSQQEALQACQKQRVGAHPPAQGLHHGGNLGPCGEFAAVPPGTPNSPNGQPPNENNSNPNEPPQH